MSSPIVAPRPEASPCHHAMTRPQIREIKTRTHVITEAHYICPTCTNRFKIGTLSEKAI